MSMNSIDLSWRTATKSRVPQSSTPFSAVAARLYRWHPPGWSAAGARKADALSRVPGAAAAAGTAPRR